MSTRTFNNNSSATGGSGIITSGSEIYLGVAFNDSSSYNMAITFGNYVISAYKNASNVYVTTTQLRNSHGAYEVVPNFVEWAGGTGSGGGNGALYKSEDGLYLYSAKINVLPASVYELVVTKYDTTGTLLNTYTTTGGPFILVPEAMALIVIGAKILVSMAFSATPITTAFWTEFTISGATLVSPTTTNIPLLTNNLYYGAYDGTDIYIGTGSSVIAPYDPLNADVQKASYTSPNQTILSTFTIPNTVFTTSNSTQKVWNNGFNIVGTKIGLYKNTSDTSGVSSGQSIVSKMIYQEYTF